MYGENAMRLLHEGVRDEQFSLPGTTEDLTSVEIVFGQPEIAPILQSKTIRWIHLDSAGYERYDRDDFRAFLRGQGILITNSSSVYAEPCAQHVVAMMYCLARQLHGALDVQRSDRSWPMLPLRANSYLLGEQSALLLGFGAIARRLAELLSPLGMRLTGYRRRLDGRETIPMIDGTGLAGELASADHVINLLPANHSTRNFCDERFFGGMKPGSIFYNIGRGSTVDQEALRGALVKGHLQAAYLDVTDPEPLPPDHPLWTAPNCLITPHTAGGHHDEKERLVIHFLENLRRYQANEPLNDAILPPC